MQRCGFAAKGLFVMDGSTPLGARQRLLHRLRRRQARGLLRHAAGPARRRRGRGGAGARAGPLQAPPRRQAHRRDVRAQPGRLRAARLAVGAGLVLRRPGRAAQRWRRRTTRWRCCCSCWSRRCSAFFVSPLFAQLSRRHEFEADAYACAQAERRRPRARAAQAVRGQRLHADARPGVRALLLLAPAGRPSASRAARCACREPRPHDQSCPVDCTQTASAHARRRDERRRAARPPRAGQRLARRRRRDREDLRASPTTSRPIAFVNALAWICQREDHHPDLSVQLRPLRRALQHARGRRHLASTTSSAPPRPTRWSPASRCVVELTRSSSAWSSPGTAATASSRRRTASACSAIRAARRARCVVGDRVRWQAARRRRRDRARRAAPQPALSARTSGAPSRSPPTSTSC